MGMRLDLNVGTVLQDFFLLHAKIMSELDSYFHASNILLKAVTTFVRRLWGHWTKFEQTDVYVYPHLQ